ncbi:MAG TPA: FAD-binding oxidoreductase [Acidobacteriota bacterium]|nr:FAD-binding oxidoreductase [Acidobacteriota bacterium]
MISGVDLGRLRAIVGEQSVSTGESVLNLHAHDESYHAHVLPDVVVWPHNTAEVSGIARYAFERKMPMTAWGVGSSLEGNPIPVNRGIVVDFQEMQKVLAIRPEDFQVDVEAGVVYKELNKTLSRYGLFFAPDPGAAATIGGMIGNNASGIRTVKYGATKDNLARLTVVLPGGDVIRIGNRARKSSSGYDLIHLFAGSEGTLGLVTEATLKLAGLPANFMALRVTFPEIGNATDTVFQIMSSGFSPAALEFLDTNVIALLNRDRNLSMEEMPTLLMEFTGFSDEGLGIEMASIEEICRENGSTSIDKGIGRMERDRLWEMRHLTFESIKRQNPGLLPLIVDIAVPLSRYSDMAAFIKREVRDLLAYVFGHAGDGNIHVIIMDEPADSRRWANVEDANRRIVEKALEFEGTCTGEHGVGIGKRGFLAAEHGDSLELMRRIKKLVDPAGLCNPGKLFLLED